MTNRPTVHSLHPDEPAAHQAACRGDYRVHVLTRRTFALGADRILNDRATSPQQLRASRTVRPY